MGLAELATQWLGRPPKIDRDALRSAKPLRNPGVTWEAMEDGSLELRCPLESYGKGLMAAFARRAKLPSEKKIELEPVGALVWLHCDGKHTFGEISRKLRDSYQLNRIEADAALAAFLQTLGQRRLITLMVKDKR